MQSDSAQRLRLYLIRHGEVEGVQEGRVFGQTDVALSERGLKQSQQLGDILASAQLSAVYSSDLKRASQAAEMIASRNRLKVQTDSSWREINMGEWEGRSVAELHKEFVGLGVCRENQKSEKTGHQKSFDAIEKLVTGQM
ncbi:MAG: histidine phosphatase family protein [Pyrinomonadaceae bacterium]